MAYYNNRQTENEALEKLKEKIKNKDLCGVYFFHGKEEYLKRFYMRELIKGCTQDLNVRAFDGTDFELGKFLDCVHTVPSLSQSLFDEEDASSRRVIRLFDPEIKLTDSEEKTFLSVLSDIPEDVTVIFSFPSSDSHDKKIQKGIYKKISELSLCVNFERSSPQSPKLRKWVMRHFATSGIEISDSTVNALIFAVGNDMSALSFEIEKLCAYAKEKQLSAVDALLVDKICTKNVEARVFDAVNAAMKRDFEKAAAALAILKLSKTDPLMVLGVVTSTVSNIANVDYLQKSGVSRTEIVKKTGLRDFAVNDYLNILAQRGKENSSFIKKAIEKCSECDKKLKSYCYDEYILLELLLLYIARDI